MELVKRQSDNYDKRIHRVVLTQNGIALLSLIETLLEEQNTILLTLFDTAAEKTATDAKKLFFVIS